MCGNPARACSPKSEWGGFMPAPAFGVKINLSYSPASRIRKCALPPLPLSPGGEGRKTASLAGDVDLFQLLDALFQLILALEDQFRFNHGIYELRPHQFLLGQQVGVLGLLVEVAAIQAAAAGFLVADDLVGQ